MKIWVLNKIIPLWLFSWYLTLYSIYLQQWVKKYTSVLYFHRTKVSGCVHRRGKQKYRITTVGVKSKMSHKMKESQHNQYIKTKCVKVLSDLKLKTAISRFVFQILPVNKLRWFVSANWVYSLVKNKSVKFPLET